MLLSLRTWSVSENLRIMILMCLSHICLFWCLTKKASTMRNRRFLQMRHLQLLFHRKRKSFLGACVELLSQARLAELLLLQELSHRVDQQSIGLWCGQRHRGPSIWFTCEPHDCYVVYASNVSHVSYISHDFFGFLHSLSFLGFPYFLRSSLVWSNYVSSWL